MAVFPDLRLVSLAVLMLASQLDFSSATVVFSNLKAKNLPGDALGNKPDPYLKISCGGTLRITNHIQGTANPYWGGSYSFSTCKSGDTMRLQVWDKDLKDDDLLGTHSRTVGKGTNNHSFPVGKGMMYFTYSVK